MKEITVSDTPNLNIRVVTEDNVTTVRVAERYNENISVVLSFNDERDFDKFVKVLMLHRDDT